MESEAKGVPAEFKSQSFVQVFSNDETGKDSRPLPFPIVDVGRIMIYGLDDNDTLAGGNEDYVLFGQKGDNKLSGGKRPRCPRWQCSPG